MVNANQWKHKYPNGDIYDGGWRDLKRHGEGTFTWNDKSKYALKYVGSFEADKRHGFGKQEYKDGSTYEVHDERWDVTGEATMIWIVDKKGNKIKNSDDDV